MNISAMLRFERLCNAERVSKTALASPDTLIHIFVGLSFGVPFFICILLISPLSVGSMANLLHCVKLFLYFFCTFFVRA